MTHPLANDAQSQIAATRGFNLEAQADPHQSPNHPQVTSSAELQLHENLGKSIPAKAANLDALMRRYNR